MGISCEVDWQPLAELAVLDVGICSPAFAEELALLCGYSGLRLKPRETGLSPAPVQKPCRDVEE